MVETENHHRLSKRDLHDNRSTLCLSTTPLALCYTHTGTSYAMLHTHRLQYARPLFGIVKREEGDMMAKVTCCSSVGEGEEEEEEEVFDETLLELLDE
jgi:hypothetical protein